MNHRRERIGTILRALLHEARTERITFMAGTIAYNAFLSLLPFLFLLLAAVQVVGSGDLESNVIALTRVLVTPGAGDILVSELRDASVGASAVGLLALVWGMLRIFRSLDMAFSDIYETQAQNTLANQVADGIVVFGSIALVIVVVATLESVVGVSTAGGGWWILQRLAVVVVVALALVPLYYLFPDETGMGVVEVLPGVAFTAVGLVGLQSAFGIYVDYSSQTAENTMLASIIVFLTWLYFCGLVILLGAVINAVLTNRSEDVNVEPVVGGVPRTAEVDDTDLRVPEATLERLNHALAESSTVSITLADGEVFEFRSPDIVTVDADTSPLPGINDTASIRWQWSAASHRATDDT